MTSDHLHALREGGSLRPTEQDDRTRTGAVVLSLSVSIVLLVIKFIAYRATGSAAVLSDALESIVNVLAAGFALGGIVFAGRPADRNHPYGHGKVEFFSAAFEGGLIAFAALLIVAGAVQALIRQAPIHQLDTGLLLVGGAGAVNCLLGLFLIRTGKRHNSLTLIADGQHVISDFWTSAGVVVGLFLVKVTGISWLDPVVAAIIGLNLFRTGFSLVRTAAGGLLDEEDPTLVARLVRAIEENMVSGIIRVHSLRAIRAGRFHHVDAHLVVPETWSVERAHGLGDELEAKVMTASSLEGEIAFHLDPCERAYCRWCDVADCPVRVEPFRNRPPLTIEEAVQPDPPKDAPAVALAARS